MRECAKLRVAVLQWEQIEPGAFWMVGDVWAVKYDDRKEGRCQKQRAAKRRTR
jgi:hypothetical protein